MSKTSKRTLVSNALKSGVMYGGTALLSAVNNITPHFAGAVDIIVVEQPDKTLKSTPFYVRFGKYTTMRTKDKTIKILINNEPVDLTMHLGAYGQAYFTLDAAEEIDSLQDDDEQILAGIMSPPSGYSSGEDMSTNYAENGTKKRSDPKPVPLREEKALGSSPPNGFSPTDQLSSSMLYGSLNSDAQSLMLEGTSPLSCSPTASKFVSYASLVPEDQVGVSRQQPLRQVGFPELGGDQGRLSSSTNGSGHENHSTNGSSQAADQLGAGVVATYTIEASVFQTCSAGLLSSSLKSGSSLCRGNQMEAADGSPYSSGTLGAGMNVNSASAGELASFVSTSSVISTQTTLYQDALLETTSRIGNGEESLATSTEPAQVVGLVASTLEAISEIQAEARLKDGEQSRPSTSKPSAEVRQESRGQKGRDAASLDVSSNGLAGFDLALCASQLRQDMTYSEASRIFNINLVTADMFSAKGLEIYQSPELVVRMGGTLGAIYPWSAVAPMVMGLLAFGVRMEALVQPGSAFMPPEVPLSVKEQNSSTQKASAAAAASGWRLWPFSGWRDWSTTASPPRPVLIASKANGDGVVSPTEQQVTIMSPRHPRASEGVEEEANGKLVVQSTRTQRSVRQVLTIARKTLNPTASQLQALNLTPGRNRITFRLAGGTADLHAYVYYFKWNTKIVISDIDGTITKSDVLGHLLPAIGYDWSHEGITKLYTDIRTNGYEMVYLSSRSIAQANITRDFVLGLKNGAHCMPVGPVIISPHGLLPSLYREMILRRPHEFKIGCLQDIRSLFPVEWNPFHAGFGNRDTDVISYREAGVPEARIFVINPRGELRKATTAVQSSTWSSISAINALVNDIFPPLAGHPLNPDEVCSFTGFGQAAMAVVAEVQEAFNDLQFWGGPPTVLSTFEVDEVEAELMGAGRSIDNLAGGKVPLGAFKGRASSDFLSLYNPYAV